MKLDEEAPELRIKTDEAQALTGPDVCQQLEQLVGLRDWLARLQRDIFEIKQARDEASTAAGRDYLTLASTIVSIVDELRRLSNEANVVIEETVGKEALPETKGWLRRFNRQQKTPPFEIVTEWIKAIQRSVASATTKLESLGIHHIELVDKDLRDLIHEGQRIKAWVSVKNVPQGESLVVQEELQGLWVGTLENQLVPIQRGEVLIK